jgi:hypothetical protein
MINFDIGAVNNTPPGFEGLVSASDARAFEDSVGGIGLQSYSAADKYGRKAALEIEMAAAKTIQRNTRNQISAMLAESVGAAAKKTTETADKIKF